MTGAVLGLIAVAFVLAAPLTWLARAMGRRLGALDGPGVAGQVKAAVQRVPNTGGVGIFWGIALPIAAGVLVLRTPAAEWLVALAPGLKEHLPGLAQQTGPALVFVGALAVLHIVGLIDDRRPMGPWLKLAVMLACGAAVVIGTESRLLTLLDGYAGGAWASVAVTVLWIVVVTNALNFMDNMDGLAAGVAAIASTCFLAATLLHERPQWFVGACLALVIGACLGFLVFNFPRPRATIFMGDGGSLVLGFALGFLTVRTTYYDPAAGGAAAGGWYGVFMPVVILAVPLYDFASVCVIRISQGRSPFVGDLQHLSHRLERHGLSRRDAVLIIYGLTAVTALGGIVLASLAPWQAVVLGVQTLAVLATLAVYEGRRGAEGRP
ncbi:MAG: undecaprenyl/decaprenyl-phosphate alpha-N-acetylglucosaminyl 1-phosphate transferase [Phycisphaerae bacterium]|nr:undecaprenyl/decaprenyl-phosphate alpha-N-acetylglucosaminyl 1-phosphate transferase [Phycisphaerae bacterium]